MFGAGNRAEPDSVHCRFGPGDSQSFQQYIYQSAQQRTVINPFGNCHCLQYSSPNTFVGIALTDFVFIQSIGTVTHTPTAQLSTERTASSPSFPYTSDVDFQLVAPAVAPAVALSVF